MTQQAQQEPTPEQALALLYNTTHECWQTTKGPLLAIDHERLRSSFLVVQQRLQEFDALQAESKSQPDEPKVE